MALVTSGLTVQDEDRLLNPTLVYSILYLIRALYLWLWGRTWTLHSPAVMNKSGQVGYDFKAAWPRISFVVLKIRGWGPMYGSKVSKCLPVAVALPQFIEMWTLRATKCCDSYYSSVLFTWSTWLMPCCSLSQRSIGHRPLSSSSSVLSLLLHLLPAVLESFCAHF